MAEQCQHCTTPYAALQRAGETHLFNCATCNIEYCTNCISRLVPKMSDGFLGQRFIDLICPICRSESIDQFELESRFTLFSTLDEINHDKFAITLLYFIGSAYSKRSEQLIAKSKSKLTANDCSTHFLNENELYNRELIYEFNSDLTTLDQPGELGSLIWTHFGNIVHGIAGGPYLTHLDICQGTETAIQRIGSH